MTKVCTFPQNLNCDCDECANTESSLVTEQGMFGDLGETYEIDNGSQQKAK